MLFIVRTEFHQSRKNVPPFCDQPEFVPPQAFIWIYAALGDKEHAFAWLEKAYEERSDVMTVLTEDRAFDPLRSDPRFRDLLRRMGLPRSRLPN